MTSQPQDLIKLESVSIIRGDSRVLDNVSWSVNAGEYWAIMGSNGCGKTTLLEIASGYLWPSEGHVFLFGEQLGKTFLPDLRPQFGFVASWVLNRIEPHIPVCHVIASGLDASIGYVSQISSTLEQNIRKELAFLEADALYHRPFGELSSGEKLKVILGRALIANPKLLILDEPFSHLDMGVRFHLYDFLSKIAAERRHTSIIMVTHHIEDIRPLFTHALLLKNGKIEIQGEVKNVITNANLKKTFNISSKEKICPS